IVGKQKKQEIGHTIQKFLRLRKVSHISNHLGMAPGKVAKFRNEMRIGKKAHIEDQVGFERYAILVAEADRRNQQALAIRLALELILDIGAQLVHIEPRGVDENVGYIPYRVQQLALGLDRRTHPLLPPPRG